VKPLGAVFPTGNIFRGLKFCSDKRHLANALAYTARAMLILGGYTLATLSANQRRPPFPARCGLASLTHCLTCVKTLGDTWQHFRGAKIWLLRFLIGGQLWPYVHPAQLRRYLKPHSGVYLMLKAERSLRMSRIAWPVCMTGRNVTVRPLFLRFSNKQISSFSLIGLSLKPISSRF